MKKYISVFLLFIPAALFAQEKKSLINNFIFDVYSDMYYVSDVNYNTDTQHIRRYAAVGSVPDEFRFQDYVVELSFVTDKFWMHLGIQNGDGPQLLVNTQARFINLINKAYFGFNISKKFMFETGYWSTPIGMESSKPVLNQISSVTMGSYYTPGSQLGIRLGYRINKNSVLKATLYNSYTYYESQTNTFSNADVENFMLSYSYSKDNDYLMIISDLSDIGKERPNNRNEQMWFNNAYGEKSLMNNRLQVGGQFTLASQNTQTLDSAAVYATAFSAFAQAKYWVVPEKFSIAARMSYFQDKYGLLTGIVSGHKYGLYAIEPAVSIEYKPLQICYFRIEFGYALETKHEGIFNDNTLDNRSSVMFTAGYRLNSSMLAKMKDASTL